MRHDIADAIESARTSRCGGRTWRNGPERRWSFEGLRQLLALIVRELPDELSVRELREEID
jgi:hypothetical protein